MNVGVRRRMLLLSTVLLASACAEPPTRELNQAQGAIDTAKAAGAAVYAVDEFRAAEASLERARKAVDERDYRQALSSSLDARERAQSAAAEASEGKARARTESDRAIQSAEAALAHARHRVEAAVAVKVPAKTLEGPERRIGEAANLVDVAKAAFEKGDYQAVAAALADITTRLTAVSSEIDALATAKPPRRPTRRNR